MTGETTADPTEQGKQAVDEELILSEFRKAVSQLGELRRRETQLLRRVALLEYEQDQARAALDSQSADAARLRDELASARSRVAELEGALEARCNELGITHSRVMELEGALEVQSRELQAMTSSTSWRLTLPVRTFATSFAGVKRRLKRLFKPFSTA